MEQAKKTSGSKENGTLWNLFSIVQCNRYTILPILVCIIPDSSSNRLKKCVLTDSDDAAIILFF